jgi:hypothetical protein
MSLALERPDYIARAAGHSGRSAPLTLVGLAVFLQTLLCVPAAVAQNLASGDGPSRPANTGSTSASWSRTARGAPLKRSMN